MSLKKLYPSVQTICFYQSIFKDAVFSQFLKFLKAYHQNKKIETVMHRYSKFCTTLYLSESQDNFADHLLQLILFDENAFTLACAANRHTALPEVMLKAAIQDLNTLQQMSTCDSMAIKQALMVQYPTEANLIDKLADFSCDLSGTDFCDFTNTSLLIQYYQQHGTGNYAKYHAFYWTQNYQIEPIKTLRDVSLDSLKKYEFQKQKVVENTQSLLVGKPSNNVLLYGDRGTGKSTLVHALLSTYAPKGLRIIQVTKEDILSLNLLIEKLRHIPLSFILFIDDLTFEDHDPAFNTLKAILEGSLNAMPHHVRIYATTNRRHLIKETFSAREGNELHAGDTRDESASLADRFGLTLTFTKPTLSEYLEIVSAIAKDRAIAIDEDALKKGATTFATRKGGRSGRIARQYIDTIEGRLALGLPLV